MNGSNLKDDVSSRLQTYGKMAIALDIANLKYRPLRDTVLNTNTQAPGVDGRIDEYITEATLEVGLEKTHGVIKGVSGY